MEAVAPRKSLQKHGFIYAQPTLPIRVNVHLAMSISDRDTGLVPGQSLEATAFYVTGF